MVLFIWLLSNTIAIVTRDWLLWKLFIAPVTMETISKVIHIFAHSNHFLATITINQDTNYLGMVNCMSVIHLYSDLETFGALVAPCCAWSTTASCPWVSKSISYFNLVLVSSLCL